ncbi:MAG: hypothetical protein AB1640_21545 [bacterium]
MGNLEKGIKAFAAEQGVDLVGTAGPGRLNGPPSMDPAYTLRGARSIVSLALPMDVKAICDFLGKQSPAHFGIEPRSILLGLAYRRKLERALREKPPVPAQPPGHWVSPESRQAAAVQVATHK